MESLPFGARAQRGGSWGRGCGQGLRPSWSLPSEPISWQPRLSRQLHTGPSRRVHRGCRGSSHGHTLHTCRGSLHPCPSPWKRHYPPSLRSLWGLTGVTPLVQMVSHACVREAGEGSAVTMQTQALCLLSVGLTAASPARLRPSRRERPGCCLHLCHLPSAGPNKAPVPSTVWGADSALSSFLSPFPKRRRRNV